MTRGKLLGFLVCALAIAALGAQFAVRLNGDAAFMLYAAGQVLDGSVLYVDILEVNPPLAIWLNLPLVALSRWLSLDPILLFRIAVTVLLICSVAAVWAILSHCPPRQVEGRPSGGDARLRQRDLVVLAAIFALFVLPRLDWGEREHLALALMLPWLMVAVRRCEGREVSKAMAVATGLAAGVGIALKPHFVLVWIGREVAIRLRSGGQEGRFTIGRLWRPDSIAPVLVCVAYLLAAIAFTPEYFPLVLELAGPYSRFIRATVLETMFGPAPAVALASLVIALGLRNVAAFGSRVIVLFCATAAWAVVALLQLKGFRYHWYPAMALGFMLLCQLAQLARGVHIPFTSRLFRAVGTAVVVTTVVLTAWGALRQVATPLSPQWDADPSIGLLIEALEGRVQPGDTLAVLSPNMASGFPLTNYLKTVWPLRLPHVWPAIVTYTSALERGESPQLRAESAMTPLERWSVDVVQEDLQRYRPKWLLVFRHLPLQASPHMAKLDLAAYLRRSDEIDRLWNRYDSLGTVGMYTLWASESEAGVRPSGDVQWRNSLTANSEGSIGVVDLALVGAAIFIAGIAIDLIASRAFESQGPNATN